MTKIVNTDEVFVTSDLHFFHKNILRFQPNRASQFASVEEMNLGIIDHINKTVGRRTLWHLGDLSFGSDADTLDLLARLDVGQMNLILGNHDDNDRMRRLVSRLHSSVRRWQLYDHYHELTLPDRQNIVLSHWPMQVWNKSHYGSLMLHGHCHSSLSNKGFGRRADVGWDSTDFGTPNRVFPITEVVSVLNNIPIIFHTHHRERYEAQENVPGEPDIGTVRKRIYNSV